MGNNSGHSSHRRQPLCFAKSILRFQLSGNVAVDLQDRIPVCLEGLSARDGYFLTFTGKLGKVPVPFTGLGERILHITQSVWEPGLKNLMNWFAYNLLPPPAIEGLCA